MSAENIIDDTRIRFASSGEKGDVGKEKLFLIDNEKKFPIINKKKFLIINGGANSCHSRIISESSEEHKFIKKNKTLNPNQCSSCGITGTLHRTGEYRFCNKCFYEMQSERRHSFISSALCHSCVTTNARHSFSSMLDDSIFYFCSFSCKQNFDLMPKTYTCSVCAFRATSMKKCSRCLQSRYCSTDCQLEHWPEHKKNCKK